MFFILIVHADYFSIGEPTIGDIQKEPVDAFLRVFFEAISIVCVNIFVLISGWFGIKPTIKGISNFIFQSLFFLTGLYIITLIIGTSELSIRGIAGCFFATKLNWFIKAYLLLYILTPVLNAFVETAPKATFKYVLIGFFTFSCTYGWINAAQFMCDGYTTLSFIGLYLLARYIKIYSPTWSLYKPNVYLLVYVGCIMFVTLFDFMFPYLIGKRLPYSLFSYICPTTIIGALSLLLCFTKNKFKNKFINWCEISCFAVFLIHANPSTIFLYKNLFIYLHAELPVIIFWMVTFVILSSIFIIAILIDKIRILAWNIAYKKIEQKFNRFIIDDTH